MQVQYTDLSQIQTLLKIINVEYQSYLPKWAMTYIVITGTIASLLGAIELAIFVSPMNSANNIDNLKKKLSYYPFVSIILPSYKEGDLLIRALNSIKEQSYPHNRMEVILAVENDDDTIRKALEIAGLSNCKENGCTSFMGDIKTKLVYGKGKGKPSALNEALKFAEGEIIGVLDADDILTKNALITAISYLINEDVDAVQLPREVILDKESEKTFKGVHIRAQEAEMFLYTKLLAPIMERLSGVSWVMGSGYFVKKDILNKLGGWEEKAATEDLDLSIRMIASGYKIKVVSESPVYTEPVRNYSQLITQKERWVRGMLLLVPKVLRHPRKSWPLLSIYLMPIAEYVTILWPIMAPYALKYAIIAFFIEFLVGFASYYTIYKRVGKKVRPLPVILAIYGITSWIALVKLFMGRAHEWKGTRLTKGIKANKE